MVKNKIIHDFKLVYDEEESVLDIYITPIKTVDHIDISFTITHKGTSFN